VAILSKIGDVNILLSHSDRAQTKRANPERGLKFDLKIKECRVIATKVSGSMRTALMTNFIFVCPVTFTRKNFFFTSIYIEHLFQRFIKIVTNCRNRRKFIDGDRGKLTIIKKYQICCPDWRL